MSPRYHITADWPGLEAASEHDAINRCFWAVAENASPRPVWTAEEIRPPEEGDDEHDE